MPFLSVVGLLLAIPARPGGAFQPLWNPALNSGTHATTALFMALARGKRYAPIVKEQPRPPMNEEINFMELRVVTPNPKGKDEALGVMSKMEALQKAKELGNLDLILINGSSDPPVCKIVDYSKYRYSQEKKAKEVKKHSKTSEVKEVKMSYKIDVHDYSVRKKNAQKFLKQGNRVKCTVQFRGREVQHDNLGFELLDKLATELGDTCLTEGRPKREGKNLSLILTPRPEVMKALGEERRKLERAKKLKRQQALEAGRMVGDDDEEDDDEEEEYEDDDDDEEETEAVAPKTKAEKSLEEILGTDEYF
jgi:translation initiation factor IF-3